MKKIFLLTLIVALVAASEFAMAKKRLGHHTHYQGAIDTTGELHRSEFPKMLQLCRDKYGHGNEVRVVWEGYAGKYGWLCYHH